MVNQKWVSCATALEFTVVIWGVCVRAENMDGGEEGDGGEEDGKAAIFSKISAHTIKQILELLCDESVSQSSHFSCYPHLPTFSHSPPPPSSTPPSLPPCAPAFQPPNVPQLSYWFVIDSNSCNNDVLLTNFLTHDL